MPHWERPKQPIFQPLDLPGAIRRHRLRRFAADYTFVVSCCRAANAQATKRIKLTFLYILYIFCPLRIVAESAAVLITAEFVTCRSSKGRLPMTLEPCCAATDNRLSGFLRKRASPGRWSCHRSDDVSAAVMLRGRFTALT